MGFFAQFDAWLRSVLTTYIADHAARVASVLEPALIALAVAYVMVWGYLHLLGRIDEPFATGIKRLVTLVAVLGLTLHLWLYNDLIVDTFFAAPSQLAAGILGAYDPVSIVDAILFAGDDTANLLLTKAGVFHGSPSFYLAAVFVYLMVGLAAVYTMFLLALSRIALSVLLALGPLFIALFLFDATKRFCEAWIAQLANYALIAVLAVLFSALMLQLLRVAAEQAVATGGGITIADAVRVCLAAGLTLLVMRQVTHMAAGLASGVAIATSGVVSAVLLWGMRGTRRSGSDYARGLFDGGVVRSDSFSRRAGYYTKRGLKRRVPRDHPVQAQ